MQTKNNCTQVQITIPNLVGLGHCTLTLDDISRVTYAINECFDEQSFEDYQRDLKQMFDSCLQDDDWGKNVLSKLYYSMNCLETLLKKLEHFNNVVNKKGVQDGTIN